MLKYVVGIDVGGTNIKAGILKNNGEILKTYSIKTEAFNGAEDVLNRIKNLVEKMLDENNVYKADVLGIGMGIPGPVNTDTGVVNFCANMVGWENFPAAEKLEKLTGLKVKVGNDVNVITLGEDWLGAAKGYKNVLGITLGTGIGGGIILNGHLISGTNGAAGEIGHMKVIEDGKLCGCGQKGCWEAYASATGLEREAVSRLRVNRDTLIWEVVNGNFSKVNAKVIFDAAKKGDKFALDLVDYEVKYLSIGLSNLINILNPEIVVIGGGVSLAGDILFNKLNKALEKDTLKVSLDAVKIVPAKLGNSAGLVGAAALIVLG
ncbi:ROK family protein [Haliovirga abyssi]|uniref:Glucokinase n=1 Tax=Haliovirga abyssi TaxID=2996794 RepID=A0AAU9DET8_9FUSO|nr:ROK family glucokinase [Haliovirga abyssi]BDU49867.1 glucokinase [Haliovirga abyssi]